MNGLEAIKFMEQGNMVQNERCIYKIKNGEVLFKNKLNIVNDFLKSTYFDFTDDYEEYVEPKSLTGWERVEEGCHFSFISGNENIYSYIDDHSVLDDEFYENANYFSTKEKVEEISFKQTLFRKLQRFSDENGGDKINWKNGLDSKWHIYFDYHAETLEIYSIEESRDFGQVYFDSRKVAEKALELFHDDLIKYYTYDWREQDGN